MEVKSSRPAAYSEVKEILEGRKKEQEQLGYEQTQSLENLEKFTKFSKAETEKLVEKIAKAGKLNDDQAVKVVDVRPGNPGTLRAVLAKDRVEVSDEQVKEILDLLG